MIPYLNKNYFLRNLNESKNFCFPQIFETWNSKQVHIVQAMRENFLFSSIIRHSILPEKAIYVLGLNIQAPECTHSQISLITRSIKVLITLWFFLLLEIKLDCLITVGWRWKGEKSFFLFLEIHSDGSTFSPLSWWGEN